MRWRASRAMMSALSVSVSLAVYSARLLASPNPQPPDKSLVATSARPQPDRAEPPVPQVAGEVLEIEVDPRSGVASAWMSNGILLHHKRVDPKPAPPADARPASERTPWASRDGAGGSVSVAVCVAGSELLETEGHRGISQAAMIAWDRLSVKSMRRDDLVAFAEAQKVRVWGSAAPTAFILRIDAKPDSLESGLRIARLLLTEPKITEEDLQGWRDRLATWQHSPRAVGRRLVSDTMIDLMFAKADARPRRASDEAIARLTCEEAQQWLDTALGIGAVGRNIQSGAATGITVMSSRDSTKRASSAARQGYPIEVAIVGDISAAEAIRLGALYFGSLAERPRISPQTFGDVRKAERSPEPFVGTRVADRWSGSAFIVGGFMGADLCNLPDHRALSVLAEIIENRMEEWPIEDRGGAGGGGGGEGRNRAVAQAVPGSAYPGFGLLIAATEVPPERADSVLTKLSDLLDQLREKGPTVDEVVTARQTLAVSAHDMQGRAGYWSSILASSVYHGLSPAALAAAEPAYAGISLDDVRDAIRKYDTSERRIRLKIVPGVSVKPPAVTR